MRFELIKFEIVRTSSYYYVLSYSKGKDRVRQSRKSFDANSRENKTFDFRSQFHQHFKRPFLHESKLISYSLVTYSFVIFWRKNIGAKGEHKMLMKLTPAEKAGLPF